MLTIYYYLNWKDSHKINDKPSLNIFVSNLFKLIDVFVMLDILEADEPVQAKVEVEKRFNNPIYNIDGDSSLYRKRNEQYIGRTRIGNESKNENIKY